MKESRQSINQMILNKEYLDLYFSKLVRDAEREKTLGCRGQILLGVEFLLSGRWKELIRRLINRKKNSVRPKSKVIIGTLYREDLNREYSQTFKVAVYTAIYGTNTPIIQPMFCNPDYDYFIFTDQTLPEDSLWKRYDLYEYSIPVNLNGAGKNRWVKMHPHYLFKDYDYAVYLDGGIRLISDVMPFISQMNDKLMATHKMSAPVECVYESAMTVISSGKASKDKVHNQMEYYKKEGFPSNWGMYENGFLIFNIKHDLCSQLLQTWWNEMCRHTMRDQLSLSYVLWKLKINREQILILGESIFNNPRFRFNNLKIKI